MTDLGMIVRMVIYRCRELNNPVTETLAAYIAQTTLNPSKCTKLLIRSLSRAQSKSKVSKELLNLLSFQ